MFSISAKKRKKEDPVAKPTAGGKSTTRKHPDAKGKSPVPMVIQPTDNGRSMYHYPLSLPT